MEEDELLWDVMAEIEAGTPLYFIMVSWREGADEVGLAALIQGNWSRAGDCPPQRAVEIVRQLRENPDDAAALGALCQREAEHLVRQASALGAAASVDR